LITSSYFTLVDQHRIPAGSLILFVQNRNGYGALCEFIAHGRTHADKRHNKVHEPSERHAGLP
jgi:DNA polymerase III alpha subunit